MKRFYLLMAALAVLVAACGGTTTETTAANDSAAAQTPQGDAETSDQANPGDTDPSSGDIDLGEDGELGLDDFIPGAQAFGPDTDFRSLEMEAQQKIAECMAEEGFEYIPYVRSEIQGGFEFDEFDQEEYVKTYGFSVSTWVLQDEIFSDYDEESDPDPNRPIVDAMDDVEREEYYRVLGRGEPAIIADTPQEELDAMTDEELQQFYDEAFTNWVPDGCEPQAYEELYAFDSEADMAFWEEFGQDFDDIYLRVESDPRIVEAQAGWSSCMAEKGHDYADQEEMFAYFHGTEVGGEWVPGEFQQRVDEVFGWSDEPVFEEEFEGDISASSQVTVVVGEGDVIEGEGDGESEYFGPEYDMEELQPLIDEEIAVATADYECSKDMRDLWETVYEEAEQQFIEDNLDRLLAFSAANG